MITGYDSVVIARTPVGAGVRAMLDGVHTSWPDMLVAIGEAETFLPWLQTRRAIPAEAGELYVARDAAMEQEWDEVGYALMAGGEGPFAVLYQPSPQPTIAIRADENPYEHRGFGFDPYAATLITTGLSLVTIVTPDEESPFSKNLRALLNRSIIDQLRH
ncbi:hypothetical protein [Actinoplanes regularis]|uniref:hypothetical protein n=1 Tax=Actinoplanes regularis TaxID=52697 RepID=UPI00249F9A4B|nr:hypothetical protein [Actinoplanes regularis]GLW29210.1 hypothetical protein Areg01_21500 [Actinoplanes regularis]